MARGVHIRVEISDNLGIVAEEIVFEFLDSAIIARDNGRRKNNGVGTLQANKFVSLIGHTHQSGKLFALSTSGYHHNLVWRILLNILYRDEVVCINKIEMFDNFDVSLHTATLYQNFPAVASGGVQELYDSFNLGSKSGQDHPTGCRGHNRIYIFQDRSF